MSAAVAAAARQQAAAAAMRRPMLPPVMLPQPMRVGVPVSLPMLPVHAMPQFGFMQARPLQPGLYPYYYMQ